MVADMASKASKTFGAVGPAPDASQTENETGLINDNKECVEERHPGRFSASQLRTLQRRLQD